MNLHEERIKIFLKHLEKLYSSKIYLCNKAKELSKGIITISEFAGVYSYGIPSDILSTAVKNFALDLDEKEDIDKIIAISTYYFGKEGKRGCVFCDDKFYFSELFGKPKKFYYSEIAEVKLISKHETALVFTNGSAINFGSSSVKGIGLKKFIDEIKVFNASISCENN